MTVNFFRDRRFAPRPLQTLFAALFVAATVALGQWQSGRAQEKLAWQQQLDQAQQEAPVRLDAQAMSAESVALRAQSLALRSVSATGEFLADRTLFIDNRVYRGVPGYHVVTPLRLEGGAGHVLVNRGWVRTGDDRSVLPAVGVPAGRVQIMGIASVPPAEVYELGVDAPGDPVRQHLVIERLADELGLPLQPFVILQTSDAADGLVRDWPRPSSGVNVHRAYAVQWYALAAAMIVLWGGFSFRRRTETPTRMESP